MYIMYKGTSSPPAPYIHVLCTCTSTYTYTYTYTYSYTHVGKAAAWLVECFVRGSGSHGDAGTGAGGCRGGVAGRRLGFIGLDSLLRSHSHGPFRIALIIAECYREIARAGLRRPKRTRYPRNSWLYVFIGGG